MPDADNDALYSQADRNIINALAGRKPKMPDAGKDDCANCGHPRRVHYWGGLDGITTNCEIEMFSKQPKCSKNCQQFEEPSDAGKDAEEWHFEEVDGVELAVKGSDPNTAVLVGLRGMIGMYSTLQQQLADVKQERDRYREALGREWWEARSKPDIADSKAKGMRTDEFYCHFCKSMGMLPALIQHAPKCIIAALESPDTAPEMDNGLKYLEVMVDDKFCEHEMTWVTVLGDAEGGDDRFICSKCGWPAQDVIEELQKRLSEFKDS